MRIFRTSIIAAALVALVATTTISRRSEANPALAVGLGVFVLLGYYGMSHMHHSDAPIGYEENIAKNLRAMESNCQKSTDLEQINLYTKFYDFNRNKFYPRFKAQMEKTENRAGLEIVDRLEKLKVIDQNSFDWNLTNLVLATSNLVVEKQRENDGWYKSAYYTSFIYLKTWSESKRLYALNANTCGLQNVITESNADLVALTMPTKVEESVRVKSAPLLRQLMTPVIEQMQSEGKL